MSNQFLAEIRIFSCNFAPQGWAMCNGQLLSISQNTALFSLLGTFYGGDGKSNFALPNLQGSVPVGTGQGAGLSLYVLGQSSGTETVTLLQPEMPQHQHFFNATTDTANTAASSGNQPGFGASGPPNQRTSANYLSTTVNQLTQLAPTAISPSGQGLPHDNMMPYLTLNFCIAMQGVYPPRS